MVIAVDGSTPAAVSQTSGTTIALTTASFTAPGASAGTVTVNNNASTGNRHARLRVIVFTGVDFTTPIASSGEGSDSLGALDNLSYTSTVANSLGVAAVSDWDVASTTFTGASGTTVNDSASVASSINCATLLQTTPTTSGSSISLGLTSPTSTNWNYVWVELDPGADTLVLVSWAGNSQTAAPTAPTISTTTGLTFTQSNYRSKNDATGNSGQAAIWWATITAAGATAPPPPPIVAPSGAATQAGSW